MYATTWAWVTLHNNRDYGNVGIHLKKMLAKKIQSALDISLQKQRTAIYHPLSSYWPYLSLKIYSTAGTQQFIKKLGVNQKYMR